MPSSSRRAVFVLLAVACWCRVGGASEPDKVAKPFAGVREDSGAKVYLVHGDKKTFDVDLLPKMPKSLPKVSDSSEFAGIREVSLEEALPRTWKKEEALSQLEFRFALANTLNVKQSDGFLRALLSRRPDLVGLPFRMGTECRMTEEAAEAFGKAVAEVRGDEKAPLSGGTTATVAAAMQILGPRRVHRDVVESIAQVSEREATAALVRLALFSPDDLAREKAAMRLRVRREQDYTDALLEGLRYPLPSVARHAAEALIALERKDLLGKLVEVLETPDPRLATKAGSGLQMRELVRINHHRNCLLCHPPFQANVLLVNVSTASEERVKDQLERLEKMARKAEQALHVAMPSPSQPFASGADGYGRGPDDEHIRIRADATYLRQDFSAMLPVENADPWPHYQRYDFLVRNRTVDDVEAKEVADKLRPTREGEISPYHRAALFALREMTGLEATSAADWRRLLKLPKS
jgi:hypothetical protein